MKRTPLTRRTPLRAKTPLRQTSKRFVDPPRAAERQPTKSRERPQTEKQRRSDDYEAEFKAIRPYVWARSKRLCEAAIPRVCTGRAVHVHHRKLRGRGGPNTMANLLDLCFECHTWVHHHPMEATARGMLVGAREDPEAIPVKPWRL